MAETVLVRPELTQGMVAGGRVLLASLDQLGIAIDAAFWLLDEEVPAWHLVLATRLVRTDGPRILYRKVNRMLTKLQLQEVIWIDMVSIFDPHMRVVEALVGALGMTESVGGMRLDNAVLGGVRIPACLIYRLAAKSKARARTVRAAAAE
jgi:hypothetical protein